MESEKYRNNSESSSEEDDQIKGDRTSKKQSYPCTFCNRGFTNAQALGSHMNMHRKDRAKAKRTNSNSSIFNEEYLYPTYSPYVTSESSSSPNKYYPMNSFEDQRNYMCFQLPQAAAVSGVSRTHYGCFNQQEQNSFHVTRSPVLSSNQEQHWGANLSLRVGSNNVEGLVQDNELDLELRLGHGR